MRADLAPTADAVLAEYVAEVAPPATPDEATNVLGLAGALVPMYENYGVGDRVFCRALFRWIADGRRTGKMDTSADAFRRHIEVAELELGDMDA